MKPLRHVFSALVLVLAALAAPRALADAPQAGTLHAPLPPSKDLYSFADLYRLTVAAEWPLSGGTPPAPSFAMPGGNDLQTRTVAGQPPAAPQAAYVFSIASSVRPPQGGLVLAFAGIAAALWVGRRRLGYAIRG